MTEDALFRQALALPGPSERAAFLAAHCPDPALRARVEAILAAHEGAGGFLGRPADPAGTGAFAPGPDDEADVPAAPPAEGPGTRIGPYKLLRQIGEGGMGVVWMAEQEKPVRRMVALKVIKPGMDSRQVVARFEAERQALALMDHLNIAKVLDAGTTAGGRPYFIMELVKGVPITKFCDEHRLTPRERLELFIPVCRAVQHAHQKGVIHRDLKPSNVLVCLYDGRPVPKVIDFGVAKALHQKLTDRTMFTEFGAVIGTLEYMAPEQAELSQLDIDTRADLYSLGVLLYELLTGTTPFDRKRLRQAAFDELLRMIREEEPPRPSTRLSGSDELPSIAANRRTEPKKLGRLVRGELDWIVMKCLEKDRARRYETASGLADDLRCYLAHEPVEAGPPSAVYRVRKFVRRNKGPVAAAAAGLLLLVAGVAGSTWQAVRATREAARANQAEQRARDEAAVAQAVNGFVNNDLLGKADAEDVVNPDMTPIRDIKLRTVLDRAAAAIGGKFENQPLVEASLRWTLGNTYTTLKEFDAAQPHAERAYEIRRRELGEEHLSTMDALILLGIIDVEKTRPEQAGPRLAKVLEVRRRELGDDHRDTLFVSYLLALTQMDRGNDARAEQLLARTLDGQRRVLGEDYRDTRTTAFYLAVLYMRQGKYDQAESLFAKNLEVSRRVFGENHTNTAFHLEALSRYYQARERYAQAEPLRTQVLEIRRRRMGDDYLDTLRALAGLGDLYWAWGKPAQAEPLLVEAVDRTRRKQGEDNRLTRHAQQRLAAVMTDLGKYAEAESLYARLVEGFRRTNNPDVPTFTEALAGQGQNLLKQQKYAEAEPMLRECLAIRERARPDEWTIFSARSMLGECLLGRKRYAEAEPLLVQGYEGLKIREAMIRPINKARALREAAERVVWLYEAWGKPEQAAAWRAKLAETASAPPQPAPAPAKP